MRTSLTNIIARTGLLAAVVAGLSFAAPANAQFGGDAFSAGDTGTQLHSTGNITGSQTDTVNAGQSPMLQGATNGTIGPQAGDATVVSGVNTAGTVRVNNLA